MIEEKYLRYNRELVNRFISDYKLPITMNKEKYFFYFIELYEDKFKSLTKWKTLWDMIDSRYDGDANKFLEDYYQIRDNIIVSLGDNEAFQVFNTMDLNKFNVTDRPKVTTNNVYNGENLGKVFLSIDLRKANFQALKYVNKDIVLGADTYEDFIGKYTDLQYVKESKYTRQVIFGKRNPARQITIEKYLINEAWKVYKKNFPHDSCICSLSNDEIVINTCMSKESKLILAGRCADIKRFIKEELGLEVSVEYYFLEGYQLYCKESGNPRNTFYTKTNLVTDEIELVCVPAPYYALTYKLFNNIPTEEEDYHFIYEGIDCRFMEEFGIRKL
jgi:hypothetical protein